LRKRVVWRHGEQEIFDDTNTVINTFHDGIISAIIHAGG
jgi:hypothetical protein